MAWQGANAGIIARENAYMTQMARKFQLPQAIENSAFGNRVCESRPEKNAEHGFFRSRLDGYGDSPTG